MRAVIALPLLALLPGTALAEVPDLTVSKEQVLFTGGQKLYRGNEFEFTWPEDSFIALTAKVNLDSELAINMIAESELSWPEALTQKWIGITDGGALEMVNKFDMRLSLTLDAFGYVFNYNIWQKAWDWVGNATYNSLLLPGQNPSSARVDISGADDLFYLDAPNFGFEMFGFELDIDINGGVEPNIYAQLTGLRLTTGAAEFTDISQAHVLPVPAVNTGKAALESLWEAQIDSKAGIILRPELAIDVYDADDGSLVGDFAFEFPYTVWLADDDRVYRTKPVSYDHALPAIAPAVNSLNLGNVIVGEEKTGDVVINNLGEIELEGEATIEGAGFTLQQPDISSTMASPDTITVKFRPNTTGAFTGTITVETNDPVRPEIEIVVQGTGVEAPDIDDTDDSDSGDTGEQGSLRGCNCSASGASPVGLGGLMLGLLGLAGLRRRR